MDSIAFYPHSSLSSLSKPNLGIPRLFPKEISLCTSRSNNLLLIAPSMKIDGNRRGVSAIRSTETGKSAADNNKEKALSSDGPSYDLGTLEEIRALFRRIKNSISEEGSTTSVKRRSNSSKELPSAKPAEATEKSSIKSKELLSTGWRDEVEKAEKTLSPAPAGEIKPTRPPSNFVKRSPIAPLKIPNGKDELKSGPLSSDIAAKEELKSLEGMKLPALKELAKSRGIRGYSKLKKSELLELLTR